MTTNAYAAKRAFFARLGVHAAQAAVGEALHEVQVVYAWPGATVENKCVYGGQVTFDHPGDGDMVDGPRRLVREVATIGVHIRVSLAPRPERGIEESDEQAEAIGEAIGALFAAEPHLAGGHSVIGVAGGQGDYGDDDDSSISVLSYQVTVESYIEE